MSVNDLPEGLILSPRCVSDPNYVAVLWTCFRSHVSGFVARLCLPLFDRSQFAPPQVPNELVRLGTREKLSVGIVFPPRPRPKVSI
jgi:hypothetical protein